MTAQVFGDADAEKILVPTAIKTSAYTAAAQDFVLCNASGGAFTVTMPTTPPDKTRVGVSLIHTSGSTAVTVAGGSATFNADDGPTLQLTGFDQTIIVQYVTASNIWYSQSGPFFTGFTMRGYIAPAVVQLVDAATITLNAAAGNDFRVTLNGSRNLANPTSPTDGQRIDIQVTQDGVGSRTLAYGTAYEFPTSDPAPTLTATPGYLDILSFVYNASKGRWLYTGAKLGFS